MDRADFAMIAKGDGMSPTFFDGDTIYIREQPDVEDGQIAAVIIGDTATLGRIYGTPEGLTLVRDNANMLPMAFRPDEVRILGRAIGYTRMFS